MDALTGSASGQVRADKTRKCVLFVIGALYATQYIPLIFSVMAIPVVLRQSGHSATAIGLVQLAALPYMLKFLWAPLVDRWSPGRRHYSSWIMALSLIHALLLVLLAFTDPGGDILPLMAVLTLAIFAISTQDVAVDALAIRLLKPADRNLGASFQAGGGYIGALIGGGLFLTFYAQLGWTNALLIQAALFAIPVFSLALISEPQPEAATKRFGWQDAIGFFRVKGQGRWIVILMIFRLPLMITLMPMQISLVDAGMGPEQIGLWMGVFAMTAAATASVVFGQISRGLERRRVFLIAGFAALLAAVSILAISFGAPDALRWGLIIAWGTLGFADVAIFAGAMDRVRPSMPGFDFSLQLALLFVFQTLSEPLVGAVFDRLGPKPIFATSVALAILALIAVLFAIGKTQHADKHTAMATPLRKETN